jgi:regulator of sigma E protease
MAMVSNLASNFALYALAFLFVLSIVVFVHELGHFLVARWCGVKVQAFSIGFGREIWGFDDRHGTRWRVAWIPLGGYVKFIDDENGASVPDRDALDRMSTADRAGSFHAKPVWQRAAVVAAGPIANFLLAVLIFAAMAMIYGVRTTEPRVGTVLPDHPAAVAGFQAGDLVVAIDGREIESFNDLQRAVSLSAGRQMPFLVDRQGQRLTLKVTPSLKEQKDEIAGKHSRPIIGISPAGTKANLKHKTFGPVEALVQGVEDTRFIIVSTWTYIRDVFTKRQSADQLGGVARIADVAGQAAKLGPEFVIQLIAVISVSVGFINLMPIPLLDGGHLLFYAIEAIRRRPLSERTQEIGFRIGLAVVLGLMIFSTFNDLPIIRKWFS